VLTDPTVHPEAVERLRRRATVRVLDGYPDEPALTEACRLPWARPEDRPTTGRAILGSRLTMTIEGPVHRL
jgi:hypothetical protein